MRKQIFQESVVKYSPVFSAHLGFEVTNAKLELLAWLCVFFQPHSAASELETEQADRCQNLNCCVLQREEGVKEQRPTKGEDSGSGLP